MIPVELVLRNFLAYRDPGPLSLEGMHVACLAGPNGAGKSSLLDAITWCLWGKARTSSADDLIHQGEDEMSVSLTFEQGGRRFKVMRQRKGGKRGVSVLEFQGWDSEVLSWSSLSEATIRDTQSRIDELMRLDYETFVNSAFLVQGRADEFTMKTPSQRKQILSNILGLARWEVYEAAAKEKVLESRTEIERLTGRLEEVGRELDSKQEVEAALAEAEREANRLATEKAETERAWSGLEKTREQLITHQRQIDDLTRRIEARRKEMAEVEQERQTALEQSDAAAIQAALDDVRGELESLEAVNMAWEQGQGQRTSLAEEAAQLKGVNQALGPESEPIKRRVATLESASDPTCPTCGQPLTNEHRHQLVAELSAEIEAKREVYRQNLERVREIDAQVGEIDRQLKNLRQQIAARPGLEKRFGELEAALKHAGEALVVAENLGQRLTRWEEETSADEAKRAGLEEEIARTELELKKAALTEEAVEKVRLESRLADERVGAARQRIAALEAFKSQSQKLSSERQQEAETLGLYEDLRDAFGKRGVPAMIIETVVPELERNANELLARMTDGRLHVRIETQREIKTGEVREALDIIISDELGSRPYELYSGGEAFRIDFAIRIALSRLLARRAGAQLRSLFIDEGFGTQDANGREHMVEAINSIQDDFDRIMVITHIEELKEAFPARIEVRKSPEGSIFSFS